MDKAPKWFVPVAVLALAWNLFGCAMYLLDALMSPDALARLSAADQALHAARPAWAVGATAVAVWFGAAGCVALIMRRSWAMQLLVLSLLGVIVQDVFLFGMTPGIAVPLAVYAVQALVLAVALALIWMTRVGRRNNWLYARA